MFTPLPPVLSAAAPLTKMLPRGKEEPFFGLVMLTVGGVVSGFVAAWVVADACAETGPSPAEFVALTL